MPKKVKFDVSGQDPEKTMGGAFPLPKPGWYNAKIDKVTYRKEKGDFEFQVVITDKKAKGFRLWDYINFENEAIDWKIAQFLAAIGAVKPNKSGKGWAKAKGTLDVTETEGTEVSVRVKRDSYDGEPTAKMNGWGAPIDRTDDDEDEDDDEDTSEDEDDEEDEDEDSEEQDEDDDDSDDEDEEDEDEDEGEDDDSDEDDEEEEEEQPKKKRAVKKTAAKKKAAPIKKGKKTVKRKKGDLPF